MGVINLARFISHRYSNIEVIVSGLLPRDIQWSTRSVKINEANGYLLLLSLLFLIIIIIIIIIITFILYKEIGFSKPYLQY